MSEAFTDRGDARYVNGIRYTVPKLVIRRCGMDDTYLQADGAWGSYTTAKRFKNQEAAEKIGQTLDVAYGLFPVSKSRRVRH